LLESLARLVPWLVMTVVIILVSSKCTLDRAHWKRSIWIYLAAFALSLAVVGAFAYFGPPPPLFSGQISAGILPWSQHSRSMAFLVLSRVTLQIPTFWGLVAVAQAIRFYERENLRGLREAELHSRLAEARLHALQLQLNPHFLFNTLNSVASLVHDSPATAEKMIEALSELLRLALNTSDRQRVTLREELHFLDHYLLIEHIRFGSRLRVETLISEAVLDDVVPALILQPLVENAIKHGVETQLAPGIIQITAQAAGAGNFLRLEVSNNGSAFPSAAGKIEERIGLSNTRARLREMFGAEASLELHPVATGGCIARILMPRRISGPRGSRLEFASTT
jgi:two-component system LytT family sensor kinase